MGRVESHRRSVREAEREKRTVYSSVSGDLFALHHVFYSTLTAVSRAGGGESRRKSGEETEAAF